MAKRRKIRRKQPKPRKLKPIKRSRPSPKPRKLKRIKRAPRPTPKPRKLKPIKRSRPTTKPRKLKPIKRRPTPKPRPKPRPAPKPPEKTVEEKGTTRAQEWLATFQYQKSFIVIARSSDEVIKILRDYARRHPKHIIAIAVKRFKVTISRFNPPKFRNDSEIGTIIER